MTSTLEPLKDAGSYYEVERREDPAQREFLADAGCRVCQGDLFAPAGPAGEVEPFLRARRAA